MNFITAQKRVEATSLIREGAIVSCATTISYDSTPDMPDFPLHFIIQTGAGWATGYNVTSIPTQVAMD